MTRNVLGWTLKDIFFQMWNAVALKRSHFVCHPIQVARQSIKREIRLSRFVNEPVNHNYISRTIRYDIFAWKI